MKKCLPWLAFSVFVLLGVGLLAYPAVSSYVNRANGSQAIQTLADTLEQTDEQELLRQRELAEGYNRALTDPEAQRQGGYLDILSFGNGVMGCLEIPKIQVSLPIYHGTGEDVLSRGIGHMPESAFPIGGPGNHAALVGHTGLPSAKILDDLVKLELEDTFTVTVLGETLTYRVDQILVVEPQETEALAPVPGEDYCTLVTCTPYGVNSHRLLVRGTRVQQAQEPQEQPQRLGGVESLWWIALLVAVILGTVIAFALLWRMVKKAE